MNKKRGYRLMKKWFVNLFVVFVVISCSLVTAIAGNVDTYGIGSKATALGGAYAAYADEPFAIFYNPAGLTQINRPTISAGVHVEEPTINIYGYTVENPDLGSVDFKDDASMLIVPHIGFAMPINDKIVAGVALYVPYGFDVKFDSSPDKLGAYNSYHSSYYREVITPSAAVKISDKLSVGGGISIGKSRCSVDRLVYDSTGLLTNIQNTSVQTEMEDSFNWSFNLGLLYKPVDQISIGITYRGKTKTEFEGTTKISGLHNGDPLRPGTNWYAYNTAVDAETEIDHPEQVQVGFRYAPHKTVSLEADVVWTRWSIIDGYTCTFSKKFLDTPNLGANNPGKTSEYYPRNWEDTRQIRFGVEWQATEMVVLRGSYFYDPTPIPDQTLDMQWVDADKKTYAIGVGLNFGNVTVDGVLQYTDIEQKREIGGESTNLNHTYSSTGASRVSLSADGHVIGAGVTVTYRF